MSYIKALKEEYQELYSLDSSSDRSSSVQRVVKNYWNQDQITTDTEDSEVERIGGWFGENARMMDI